MKKKILASIEARMTSSRLPGKVLMESLPNVSMLEYMINRVKKSKLIDDVVIATTDNKEDNPIVELCKKINIKYFRGSEDDVLLRVLKTHKYFKSDIIVELTGDCPLIDFKLMDKIIKIYIQNNYDYVSNSHERSYPDGFDVQVFSTNLLDKVSLLTNNLYDRENVSSYIYRSGKYKTYAIIAEPDLFWPDLRVTLDDVGDYLLLKNIINKMHADFDYNYHVIDVVNYIKNNPDLLKLNKDARVVEAPYQKIAKNNE